MDNKWLEGQIESFNIRDGHGYLQHSEYGKILIHYRSLGHGVSPEMLKPGTRVRFVISSVRTGYLGRLVTPIEESKELVGEEENSTKLLQEILKRPMDKRIVTASSKVNSILPGLKTSGEYLAAALLFKEQKRLDDAHRVYQAGLKNAPEVNLVLSYAAFEKNRNRPDATREIYRKGVDLFPAHQKLHEDAGVWELKNDNPEQAIKYLERALTLHPSKGSRAYIHRWLAKAYYALSTKDPYHIDMGLLEKARVNLKQADSLSNLSHQEITLQNRMGAIKISPAVANSFLLFEQSGFEIIQIFKPDTHCIDFIAEPINNELRTTYGLGEPILIRHLLTDSRRLELSDLDVKLDSLVVDERADPTLAFLIVKNSKPFMDALRRRLESGGQATTIIPIELSMFSKMTTHPGEFRNLLDQWLFRRDLYRDNSPVSGNYFFGRDVQLKKLFANIAEGRHVGIFGLRKVGKTSFLWRVREKSTTDLVAYIDLLGVPPAAKSCDYVFWLLGNELAKDFIYKYPDLARKAHFRLFGIYREFISVIDKPISLLFDSDLNKLRDFLTSTESDIPPKIIILIDEVERLLPMGNASAGFNGYVDFFSYWRGQAQQHQDLVTVITGANPAIAEQAQWQSIDNPVYKFYQEEFLSPLVYSECAIMAQALGTRMGVNYTKGALRQIYNLTGGHPFIARRLCSRICQRRPARPLTVDDQLVNDAIPDFMQEDSNMFDEILARLNRDFPEELKVLELVAKNGKTSREDISKIVGSHSAGILRHLIGYQLVSQVGDQFQIGIELLRGYMVNN
jgi:tetratricopeptide (TPR) repeat protein